MRERIGKAFLVIWGAVVSVLLTLLASTHIAPFAANAAIPVAVPFIKQLTQKNQGWQILHIIADKCSCSAAVAEHLLQRKPDPRVSAEAVVVVGHRPDLGARFSVAGFPYQEMEASHVVEMTNVEAAPTMVIIDDHGKIRYTGGYYAQGARTQALDQIILGDVMVGKTVSPLPTFGCAFSRRLQQEVDPLGLKYPSHNPEDVR